MGVYKAFYTFFLALAPFVVTLYLPFPYMDEYFHVRQTLQYVETQNFSQWDPLITTPPGLYAVAFAICQFLNNRSLLLLRLINVAPMLLTLLVSKRSLVISTFPLLVFYSTLYYTDVWSSLLVIASLANHHPLQSALLSLAALTFRQTNIVWAAVAAAFFLIPAKLTFWQLYADLRGPRQLVCRQRLSSIVPPFLVVALLFAAFLKWNGGITLGDKSNHTVSLHAAQLLYFLMFFAFFSAPLALLWLLRGGPWKPRKTKKATSSTLRLLQEVTRSVLELLVIVATVRYGTVVHPFILADNRHYTFYIWRRLISVHSGMMMVPVYWASWRWFASTVKFNYVRTWVFLMAVVLVLVPSPLMEPRYYILPYLVWRIFLYGQRGRIVEYVWNTAINLVTLGVLCLSETHFMY